MSKLNIEGKLIGTTADKVDYANSGMSGVADAKAALDNLQTRLANVEQGGGSSPGGGSEIDNADLAALSEALLVTGGKASNWWEYGRIFAGTSYHPNFLDGQLKKVNAFPAKDSGRAGTYFRVYKGDTLYYQNCGTQYTYAVIITDLELNVLDAWPQVKKADWITGISSNLDGIPITQDGWVFAGKDGSSKCPAVWTEWSERKTFANKRLKYMAFGDSISIDNAGAYIFGFPKVTARILNAEMDKVAVGGMSVPFLIGSTQYCPADVDIVTSHFGANDAGGINNGNICPQGTTGSVAGGEIGYTVKSAYMAKLFKDGGIVLQGSSVKVTGIAVNGSSIYSNQEGYELANNAKFNTSDNDIDISSLESGDVITVSVVDEGGGTLNLGPAKQIGVPSDIVAITDIDAMEDELNCSYLGQYYYALKNLLKILKKPTARIFCIGPMKMNSALDDKAPGDYGLTYRQMANGLKVLIDEMGDAKLVFLDGTRLLQNWDNLYISFWSSDRTHPNQEGHVILGVSLAVAIADVLGLDHHTGVIEKYNSRLPVS